MSGGELFNPEDMAPAIGFSYGALAKPGRTLHIAGITGHAADGTISDDIVAQFSAAAESVAKVVAEAGGTPSDVVSMMIYTSDISAYRDATREIGVAYRDVFGSHYPPMALIGISELYDPRAVVELVCVAVVPD